MNSVVLLVQLKKKGTVKKRCHFGYPYNNLLDHLWASSSDPSIINCNLWVNLKIHFVEYRKQFVRTRAAQYTSLHIIKIRRSDNFRLKETAKQGHF